MTSFARHIAPDVDAELHAAALVESADAAQAFRHLERAHVLGQFATSHHVRVHARMLAWGWRQRDPCECAGQLLRIVGALTKTAFGWVPAGNTGGAGISPFKPLPVPADLAALIERARAGARRA